MPFTPPIETLTILAALFAAVVWLNVWNYRRRASLSDAARRLEDEEWKDEQRII